MKMKRVLNESLVDDIINKLINFALSINVKKIKNDPTFQKNLSSSIELEKIEKELIELKPKIRKLQDYINKKGYDDLTLYE